MPEESSTSFAGPNRSRFEGLRPFRTLSADALPCRSSKASISCAGVSTGRAFRYLTPVVVPVNAV